MDAQVQRLAALVLLLAAAAHAQTTGSADCPCITTTDANYAPYAFMGNTTASTCRPFATVTSAKTDHGFMCYELDYGSAQCKSWDVGKNPHCVPDPTGKTALPSWCTQPWCYVDRETCKRSPNALYLSNNIFARELYYSYDTCASNATRVNGLPNYEVLAGRSLRVGVPMMRLPHTFKRDKITGEMIASNFSDPDNVAIFEDDSWAWEGFVIEYIQKLRLMTLDTPWPMEAFTFTFTSAASRDKHASTFNACVNDVQNGLVDMCAGSFWITDERLEMASFTKTIYEEEHLLFVPRRGVDTKETFAMMAHKAFRVFDRSLWIMVMGLNVFIGWVDAWMNKEEWRSDKWNTYSYYKQFKVTCGATFNGMMRYTFDIVGGGVDAVEAHCISWPNKCVRLGWGIFILILLSSYTANLAAFLTATAGRNMTMKDIDEVIDNGITICTHLVVTGQISHADSVSSSPGHNQCAKCQSIAHPDSACLLVTLVNWCAWAGADPQMRALYPKAVFKFYSSASRTVNGYLDGECGALTITKLQLAFSQTQSDKLCDNNLVSAGVVTVTPVGFPIHDEYAAGLSYWAMKLRRGTDTVPGQGFLDLLPPPLCPYMRSEETVQDDGDLATLNITNMVGPMLVLGFFLALGIVLRFMEIHKVKERVKEKMLDPVLSQSKAVGMMGLQGLKKGASVVPGANKSLEVTAELSSSIKGKLGALFQIKSAHNSKHKRRAENVDGMKKGDVEEPLRDDMVAVALLKEGPHVSLNMVSDKQARNGGTQSGRALQDGESVLVAARRAAGDDDSWSERDSEAEGMSTDELRYFVDRLCDDLAYLRNRLHNADDGDGESEDSYDHIAPAVHNGHIPREWSAQH